MASDSDKVDIPADQLAETINELPTPTSDTDNFADTISDDMMDEDHDVEDSPPTITEDYILNNFPIDSDIVQRFSTGEVLGSGGCGDVYELTDHNLERSVAIKILQNEYSESPRKVKTFIREALLTARLEHPNILPVYNLQITDDGDLYYTMKKVEGIPLSALLDPQKYDHNKDHQQLIQRYNNLREIIDVFIRVAETIAHAHSRGVIHRDIKPDNIMLDKHGAIRVVDWGIAIDESEIEIQTGKMSGTPIYMSPEQAKRDIADHRCDIYALGSTLFHLLTRRLPVKIVNTETFWAHKRIGAISAITDEEKKRIPAPLIAICMKCLAVKADDRYQDAETLVNELKAFQIGGHIQAYRYGTWELAKHWFQHNRNNVKWACVLLITAIIAGSAYYYQYQKQFAGWGKPIYEQTFDTADNWQDDWEAITGHTTVRDGVMIADGNEDMKMFFKRPIQGGMCLEFDATLLPGCTPGDISVMYIPDIHNIVGQTQIIFLQHGARGNESSTILTPGGRVDYVLNTLEMGVTYKVRGEIDGKHIRLFLDGKLICSHELLFPVVSGYLGIYTFFDNKQIDNIRIYKKELPEITNIIETGDLLLENGLFDQAQARYRQISETHTGSALGDEARYKYGLSKHKAGDITGAFEIWDSMKDTAHHEQIQFHRWSQYFKANDITKLLNEMDKLYNKGDERIQKRIRLKWAHFTREVTSPVQEETAKRLIAFRTKHFVDDQMSGSTTFHVLRNLGECKYVLEWFPKQRHLCAKALVEMGRFQEVIDNYPEDRLALADAYLHSGQFNKVIEDFSDNIHIYFEALIQAGYLKKAEKEFENEPSFLKTIHRLQGRYNEILEQFPETRQALDVYKDLNDWDNFKRLGQKLAQQLPDHPYLGKALSREIQITSALKAYTAGDKQAINNIRAIQQQYGRSSLENRHALFSPKLLDVVLIAISGDANPLEQKAREIYKKKQLYNGMRTWHNAALLLGEIDDETYLNQPYQVYIQPEFHLYKALHEDIWGDSSTAIKHYKKHASLSRSGFIKNTFTTYRIKELEQRKK